MLVSPWGRGWRRIRLAMFTAYVDDSGTSSKQPIATATLLLIPVTQIPKLESQWEVFRNKHGFESFHASKCAARNYESEFRDWSKDKVEKIFRRVRQFCKTFGVQMFSLAVRKCDYDTVVPEILRKNAGSHYTWGIRSTAKRAEEWRLARNIGASIQYIFDWQDINSSQRHEIDTAMGQLQETLNQPVYHDFRLRKDIPGLQCVDYLAWLAYQMAMDCIQHTDLHPLAKEGLMDLENFYPGRRDERPAKKWWQVATIRPHDLKIWADSEMASGKSLQRFSEWNQKHPPKERPNVTKRIRQIRGTSAQTAVSSSLRDQNEARGG